MSQALVLYRLQQIDSQVDAALARSSIIEEVLKNDFELQQIIYLDETTDSALNASIQNQRKIENEAQGLRIKIEQTESGLYGGTVRNPKELQDLQNESVALKRYLNTVEDRLLDVMQEVEELQERKLAVHSKRLGVEKENMVQNQALFLEQEGLKKEIQKLKTERLAITETLDAGLLDHYEQLRQNHRGVAVSSIRENACGACGTTLTLALIQTTRSPRNIILCPSCGRILYST